MTHSSHDDPSHKWAALKAWRDRFVAENGGREPLLWIDKCCLLAPEAGDERASDDVLRLPVYVAGCERLLVLLGPTFMRRLWCVVELVTHEYVGGGARRIDGGLLPGLDPALIEAFDVGHALCYVEEDRQRLLECVEVTSGHSERELFNDAIRETLRRVVLNAVHVAGTGAHSAAIMADAAAWAGAGYGHGRVPHSAVYPSAPSPPSPGPFVLEPDDVIAGPDSTVAAAMPFSPLGHAFSELARVAPDGDGGGALRGARARTGLIRRLRPRTRRLLAWCCAYVAWLVVLIILSVCLAVAARGTNRDCHGAQLPDG